MRVLLTIILTIIFVASSASAFDWSAVVVKTEPSLVTVEHSGHPVCSGFVIDAKKLLVLSANHCWSNGEFTVDGSVVTPVWYDYELDLMVLRVGGVAGKPALRLRTKSIADGIEVMALGHAYGSQSNYKRMGHVASVSTVPPPAFSTFLFSINRDPTRPYMALDFDTIGGMSGGAIVDTSGRALSLVQMGDGQTSLSIRQMDLIAAVGKYFN